MVAITLEQILNFIIPPIVWVFIIWILYTAFKKPIDAMIEKIKEWKENRQTNKGYEESAQVKTISYE